MSRVLLTNATAVPMDGPATDPLGEVRVTAIRVRDGRIAALGELAPEPGETVENLGGMHVLPGFVQGHVHYCQTLFRGLADDLPLLQWLQRRIWPLEAAHDAASTRASAWMSVAELLLGGTTTAQVMESVRYAEESFDVAARSGMTTILGNCLMDVRGDGDAGLPTTTAEAMRIVRDLHGEFDGRDGRMHYAVSPRFILSCSEELARDAAAFAELHGLRVHSHAAEHPAEVALVRARTGNDYILALRDQGLLGPRTALAHCVHTTAAEREALVATGTAVLHCPTANLKLGSGIAPIADYDDRGLRIALGSDGAPCNNRLSTLDEARQAALGQAAVRPGAWPAVRALVAATAGGAAALGLDHDLGTLTPGKRADLVALDLDAPHLGPSGDRVSRLVFAAGRSSIRHVMVGGEWQVRNGRLTRLDVDSIAAEARTRLSALLARSGLAR